MSLKKRRIVILGHAVGDENGGSTGGRPGNQSGKELRFQEWYSRSKGWTDVFRVKKSYRTALATSMIDAVSNKHIGYNQAKRTTLYQEALNKKWKLAAITKDCDTDCSALIAVCCNAAGIKVNKDMYTGNEKTALLNTGLFTDFSDLSYTTTSKNLIKSDILLGPGHTAMVVDVYDQYVIDRELYYRATDMLIGSDVKLIQQKLKELDFLKGKADGIFGQATLKALKAYQSANGLTADGIAGKKTIVKMGYAFE